MSESVACDRVLESSLQRIIVAAVPRACATSFPSGRSMLKLMPEHAIMAGRRSRLGDPCNTDGHLMLNHRDSRVQLSQSVLRIGTVIVAVLLLGACRRQDELITLDREVFIGGIKPRVDSIARRRDGGFVVTGAGVGAWVVATDSLGNVLWRYNDPIEEIKSHCQPVRTAERISRGGDAAEREYPALRREIPFRAYGKSIGHTRSKRGRRRKARGSAERPCIVYLFKFSSVLFVEGWSAAAWKCK